MRRNLVLGLGLAVFFIVCVMPTPAGLSLAGQRTLALFALCMIGWIGRPVDPAITGLMGLALLSILGILPQTLVFGHFGTEALFFLIGLFVFASATLNSGLVGYLFDKVFARFGRGEDALALGALLASFGLSACMLSQMIATAVLPVLLERSRSISGGRKERYASRLLVSMAFGTALGSTVTFLAGPQNILAAALGSTITGENFGSWDHVHMALPLSFISLLIIYVFLRIFFGRQGIEPTAIRDGMMDVGFPGLRREGRTVGIILVATIACVGLLGRHMSIAAIMIIGMSLVFMTQTAQWKHLEDWVPWGTLLVYGCAFTMAMTLHETGAAAWVGKTLLPSDGIPPIIVVGLFTWTTMATTALSGHPGIAVVMLPFGLDTAARFGIHGPDLIAPIAIAAGLGVMLTSRTPASAMIIGTGIIDARELLRHGWLLAHALWAILVASCFIW